MMHNPKGAWRMCVGACILQLCIVGLSINSFSVYLPYLLRKCGLTNTQSANIGLTVYAEDLSGVDEFESRVQDYQICYLLGSLLSSPIPGIIADTTGSYVPFYAAAAVLGLIALVIIENNYRQKLPK